jgi:hypothetical protein
MLMPTHAQVHTCAHTHAVADSSTEALTLSLCVCLCLCASVCAWQGVRSMSAVRRNTHGQRLNRHDHQGAQKEREREREREKEVEGEGYAYTHAWLPRRLALTHSTSLSSMCICNACIAMGLGSDQQCGHIDRSQCACAEPELPRRPARDGRARRKVSATHRESQREREMHTDTHTGTHRHTPTYVRVHAPVSVLMMCVGWLHKDVCVESGEACGRARAARARCGH